MIKQKSQPKTWRKVKLGEVAEEIRDLYNPTPDDHLKYIGLEHIEQGGLRLSGIGDSADTQSSKKKFKENDILFGTLRAYFRKVIKPKFDGVCSTDITILRAKNGIDQNFLYYFIANPDFINFASGAAEGTRMPRVNWRFLEDTVWEFPPLIEQKRIADILSAFDDKIEVNNKINQNFEQMASAIFKEWFVKFRFPGYKKTEFVDSELGKIPKEWEIKNLGEILILEYGEALTSVNRKKGDVPVYGSSGLVGYHDKKLVNGPGIIIGRAGIPGSVYWSQTDFHCVDSTFYVETKISKYFIFYLLKRQNLKSLISGSAVPGINRNIIYPNRIVLPPSDIINDFEKIISPVFLKIYKNKLENQKLAALRDLLLPKLMSGEIRV